MITTTEKVRGERILNKTTMSKKKKEQIEGTFLEKFIPYVLLTYNSYILVLR